MTVELIIPANAFRTFDPKSVEDVRLLAKRLLDAPIGAIGAINRDTLSNCIKGLAIKALNEVDNDVTIFKYTDCGNTNPDTVENVIVETGKLYLYPVYKLLLMHFHPEDDVYRIKYDNDNLPLLNIEQWVGPCLKAHLLYTDKDGNEVKITGLINFVQPNFNLFL